MKIVGHTDVREALKHLGQSDRVPNSLIFAGPDGVGKSLVAKEFVAQFLCDAGGPCYQCGPCVRVFRGESEWVKWVAPEKGLIKIDQARSIIDFLKLQSHSPFRFVVIEDAEVLNVQAANALLKVIEEPPKGVHFIFITSLLSALLSTVRSRSQVYRFGGLTAEQMLSVKNYPAWVIESSQGRMSVAEALLDESLDQVRRETFNWVGGIQKNKSSLFSEGFVSQIGDKEAALVAVQFLQQFVRDAQMLASGQDHKLIHSDLFNEPGANSNDLCNKSFKQLDQVYLMARQLESDIFANADRRLALESFSIQAAEVL